MEQEKHIRSFIKMHGLGNDFAIFDARENIFTLSQEQVLRLSDRKCGIGFDQLIILKKSDCADVFMEIWNADGTQSGACGNASRCVGYLLSQETGAQHITIETKSGIVKATILSIDNIIVDMGEPKFKWEDIPLSEAQNTNTLDIQLGPFGDAPVAVNIGNPHVVFFVPDATLVPLEHYGPSIENHPLFPEGVNVSIASVTNKAVRLRVWERGAGVTQACGTAACATAVAAYVRGLAGRQTKIQLDGGMLNLHWQKNNHILMAGPAAIGFKGTIAL